jgi:hypothetical protein
MTDFEANRNLMKDKGQVRLESSDISRGIRLTTVELEAQKIMIFMG